MFISPRQPLVSSLPLRSYCGRGEIPLQKHCELTSHGKFACSGKTWPLQVSSQWSFVLWVILSVSTTSYSYKGMRKSVSSGLKKIQFSTSWVTNPTCTSLPFCLGDNSVFSLRACSKNLFWSSDVWNLNRITLLLARSYRVVPSVGHIRNG